MATSKKRTKKKNKGIRIGIILIALLAFLAAGFFYLLFLSNATKFKDDQVLLLISEKNANKQFVKEEVQQSLHGSHYQTFLGLAEWSGYWKDIKPGRYIIKNGMGVFTLFRKLHNGSQDPVKITINKFRTKQDLANFLGKKLEASPAVFLKYMNNNDSIASLGVTKETLLTLLIPNTYEIYWNTDLGADPTVKFAVGDFSIKRVTLAHINNSASSPYNTYKNKGLPPGPICTPSVTSIDAVLKGEKTDYLYFCAKADFSGSHSFAATAEEHFSNARKYRKALDSLGIR